MVAEQQKTNKQKVKIIKQKCTIGPISQRQRKNVGCLLRHPHKIEETFNNSDLFQKVNKNKQCWKKQKQNNK